MKIKGMSLGPIGTNCYIIYDENDGIIIDPGDEGDKVITFLSEKNIQPRAILLTHAHFDHIGAVDQLRSYYSIDVYLHDNEAEWLTDPKLNCSLGLNGQGITAKRADKSLEPGKLQIDSFTFDVIHTPGHSPGSVSFVLPRDGIIVGGDVLFKQGIGRTDLYGGDMDQLFKTILEKFYTQNDSYTVYPGHGPSTTIGEEKQNNPFVREK